MTKMRAGGEFLANAVSGAWLGALTLVAIPVYLHYMGVEAYGLVGMYAAWLTLFGILDMAVSSACTRELARSVAGQHGATERYAIFLRMERIFWALLVLAAALLAALVASFSNQWFQVRTLSHDQVVQSLYLMVAAIVAQFPGGFYAATLRGLQRPQAAALNIALFGTVRIVLAILAIALIFADLRCFLLSQIAAGILQLVFMRRRVLREVDHGKERANPAAHAPRSFAIHMGGMGLITALSLLSAQIDKLLLSSMVELEALGHYAIAWSLASIIMMLATPLVQMLMSRYTLSLASDAVGEIARISRLYSRWMAILVIPPAVVMAAFSHVLLWRWTGSITVADAGAPVLTALAVGMALVACAYPAVHVMYAKSVLRPVIVVNAVALCIMLPTLVGLIVQHGAMGAAVNWALYGVFLFIGYESIAARTLQLPGAWSQTVTDVLLLGGIAIALALPSAWLLPREWPAYFQIAVILAALTVIWILALLVFPENRLIATAALRRRGKLRQDIFPQRENFDA